MLEIGDWRKAATQLNVIYDKVTVKVFCLLIIIFDLMVPFPSVVKGPGCSYHGNRKLLGTEIPWDRKYLGTGIPGEQ